LGDAHKKQGRRKTNFSCGLVFCVIENGNYLPGKNGQTIGMTMIDTIPDTITSPVPALT